MVAKTTNILSLGFPDALQDFVHDVLLSPSSQGACILLMACFLLLSNLPFCFSMLLRFPVSSALIPIAIYLYHYLECSFFDSAHW